MSSSKLISTKELTYIAIMACIQSVVFTSFSQIIYLECITLTVCLFAMVFTTKQAVLASIVFTLLNLNIQGVQPWSIMYCLIYPTYSLLISSLRTQLKGHFILIALVCGVLSFTTGQIVQIPFLLTSKKIGALYLILGLKTSLIQGAWSFIVCLFVYRPLEIVLKKIERRLNT